MGGHHALVSLASDISRLQPQAAGRPREPSGFLESVTTQPYDEPAFAGPMLAALAEHAPLTAAELAVRIGEEEEAVAEELSYRGDVLETQAGWYSAVSIADGAVLTHVITEEELALGVLTADGDLDLWGRLADTGIPYACGGTVQARYAGGHPMPAGCAVELTGPPGWLDAVQEGDLVAVRLLHGALEVACLAELPKPDAGRVAALVQRACIAADAAVSDEDAEGPGAFLHEVVLEALLVRPDVLDDPLPPTSALLAMAGLDLCRGMVGLPGTDWSGAAGAMGGLDHDDRRRLARIRAVLATMQVKGAEVTDPATLRMALDLLGGGGHLLEMLGAELSGDDELHAAVRELAAAAETDLQRAVAAYLLAVLAETADCLEEAQEQLDTARALMPELTAATMMAADYAAERSDARAADQLYRQAGQDKDSPWRWTLAEFLRPAPSDIGRNKPCACGSGRKHKLCCGLTARHPLPRRAVWRYRRAVLWTLRPAQQGALHELADVLAGAAASDEDYQDALGDPLVADMALIEGGLLETYLRGRGSLMPPDERALIEIWQQVPLALWEVQSTRPGRELTLRALPDGEPVTVSDKLLSSDVERTDLLLGRLLSDGASPRFLGAPRWVPRPHRAPLLEALSQGHPQALLAALAPGPPPELFTREHEPVVMCTARYTVPAGVWEVLAGGLAEDDGDLIELVDIDGDQVLRGRLRRIEGDLQIETNSVERLERLTGRVLAAAPGAVLVEQSQVPAAELMASASGSVDLPGMGLSPDIPADVQFELIEQLGVQAEQRWLTESIPALDGLTPRAAATDAVMRPRLLALLDDFAWQERNSSLPAVMQAARLRAALDLPS